MTPPDRAPWDMPQARLDRIAEAHRKDIGEAGLTSGCCTECEWAHPCPTYVWATTARDPLAPWDPADDPPYDNDNEDDT